MTLNKNVSNIPLAKAGATASQLFCLAALTLKELPASSLPLMAEW